MDKYDPKTIEAKWQQVWEAERAFYALNPEPGEAPERKFYMLEMLPYPSGTLHMGHVLNYTLGDVLTHFRRRNGWTVMRPMGWDSFGLPAENAAIREGGHPREIIDRNIEGIRTEMKRLGWAIDWDREQSAHRPDYYRWTQWLFLKFFELGLAYRKESPVNWCPKDQTVVANEYVIDGKCERCGTEVVAKNVEQWFFKITAYADELLDDLALLDWPERTKTIQRNWIGRSEGAEVLFRVDDLDIDIPVFTTRPDTLFGATFFVLAPEHPLVEQLGNDEVSEYVKKAAMRSVAERQTKDKDGVFTGHYATNPVNDERIPVWVADYVLMDYGTGAIMAVPAHDERDLEFAQHNDQPVRPVIDEEESVLVDSGEFTGLPVEEAQKKIVEWLRGKGRGAPAISYRLRDWSMSRQRYWGCPIPVVYCEDDGIVAVPDEELPVLLPELEDYRPKGKPPLASNEEWMNVPCPKCGKPARREADTMDTFVDSSWYFLRYCDPHNDQAPFDRRIVDYWMPVDQYIGGIDHARGHLLYSRFFMKVLNEQGLVGVREPFQRLFHQGWVLQGGKKMSKRSKGNVTGPERARGHVRRGRGAAVHPLHGPGRSGHGMDGGGSRGDLALPEAAVADRERGCRAPVRGRARADRPRARRAPHDRARDRRHRPALPVQHADRGRHGARQRAGPGARGSRGPLRRRDGGDADPAVRAAHRRGAVVAAGARAALGASVAGG